MRTICLLLFMTFTCMASDYQLEVVGTQTTYKIHVELEKKEGNSKLAILSHGYMNHCRYLDVLKNKFLQWNYDVLCFDLPGHGKSSGKKFDIDNFSTYKKSLSAVIGSIDSTYSQIDFIAHSTGTVGMTELLLDHEEVPVNNIIYLAPLVRSYLYKLSYWTWRLGGRLLSRLPVRPLGEVHPEYREIVNSDPFYPKSVPNHFAGELFSWNDSLDKLNRVSDRKITVIFGSEDTVIDINYNHWFFETYFSKAEIITLEGSNHLLFHHNDEIRSRFFDQLESLIVD